VIESGDFSIVSLSKEGIPTLTEIVYRRAGRHPEARAILLPNAPKDLRAWFESWGGPLEYLRDQNGQDIDFAKEIAAEPAPEVGENNPATEAGIAEEAATLPAPNQAEDGPQPAKFPHPERAIFRTPRTTAEKQESVLAYLAAMPAASNREIARQAGVDDKTVAAIRRTLTAETTPQTARTPDVLWRMPSALTLACSTNLRPHRARAPSGLRSQVRRQGAGLLPPITGMGEFGR
jgi:hypothetical protein